MITTILDQVTKLLGQSFLLSAVLPWLVWSLTMAATFAWLVGAEATRYWWTLRVGDSAPALAATTGLVVLFVTLGALLFNGMHAFFRRAILEGDTNLVGLRLFVEQLRRAKARRNKKEITRRDVAITVAARAQALQIQFATVASAPLDKANARLTRTPNLADELAALEATLSEATLVGAARKLIAEAPTSSPAAVRETWARILSRAEDWVDETGRTNAELTFRSTDKIATESAPTEYGEVLASTSRYVANRYGIDSIVFWSRLQPLVDKEHMAVVSNAKLQMDILTGLSAASLAYSLVWILLLPLFAWPASTALAIVGTSLVLAWLFYEASVDAARSFAETVRSAFDLFRPELLKKLEYARPDSPADEKALWTNISQFVLYDQPLDPARRVPSTSEANKPAPKGMPARIVESLKEAFEVLCPPKPAESGAEEPDPRALAVKAMDNLAKIAATPSQALPSRRGRTTRWYDWVALGLVALLLGARATQLSFPADNGLRFRVAASRAIEKGTRIDKAMLTLGVGRVSDAAQAALVRDIAAVEGRYANAHIDVGHALVPADTIASLPSRVGQLVVTPTGNITIGTRGDIWVMMTGEQTYTPALRDVEVVGAAAVQSPEGTKPTAPPALQTIFYRTDDDGSALPGPQDDATFLFVPKVTPKAPAS